MAAKIQLYASLSDAEIAQRRRSLRALPAPEPTAGVEQYRRERELALRLDPRKRQNYEKFIAAQRGASVDYLPVKLDIENVSRCNFKCTMCVVSDWPKGKRAADMSLKQFKALIDDQYGLVEIKLQGIGEPLMQGDDFFEMIRYARQRHIWVRSTTNGSLLHLKDNYRKLIDTGINELQISIDGASEDTFQAIRRGSVFSRVVQNCKMVNAYQRETGRQVSKSWTVVQSGNRGQLEKIVDLVSDMGFTNHVFSLNLSDWGLSEWNARNERASVQDDLSPENLLKLVERGQRLGVKIRFWNVNEKYALGDAKTLCPWPFERAYIGSDMRVSPCCYLGNPDVFELDRKIAGGHRFTDTWFGQDYRAFRQAHIDGRLPKVCQGCYSSTGEGGEGRDF